MCSSRSSTASFHAVSGVCTPPCTYSSKNCFVTQQLSLLIYIYIYTNKPRVHNSYGYKNCLNLARHISWMCTVSFLSCVTQRDSIQIQKKSNITAETLKNHYIYHLIVSTVLSDLSEIKGRTHIELDPFKLSRFKYREGGVRAGIGLTHTYKYIYIVYKTTRFDNH